MEHFINQFNVSEPVSVMELRSLQGEDVKIALGKITSLQLSCYVNDSSEQLKTLKSLSVLNVYQLSPTELCSLLKHIKEVTVYYRENGDPEWGLQGLIVRECQTSFEVSNLLGDLFADGVFTNLTCFHWIAPEKNRSGELGEKAWTKICSAIRSFPESKIESLRIPNNNIGERGCKEFAHLIADNKMKCLKELDISGNRINNGGFSELMKAFQETGLCSELVELCVCNDGLALKGVKMACDYMKECEFKNLQILRIGYNSYMGKKVVEMFINTLDMHPLPSLKCLDFSGIKMGEEGMAALSIFLRDEVAPALDEVNLQDCGLYGKEIEHLSFAGQDGFCKNLRCLDLSKNAMKSKGVQQICRMLCLAFTPSLQVLNLSHNALGDEGIRELGNVADLNCMVQITSLYLCHNNISDEGASCIYLYIRNRQWKNMEQLYLDDNNFSKISVIHLRSLVDMNNKLLCIYLNEMSKQRDPYIHFETPSTSTHRVSVEMDAAEDEKTDEEYLAEIFSEQEESEKPAEASKPVEPVEPAEATKPVEPLCELKRTSDQEGNWTPVNVKMTPIPENVGLGMDSEVYPTPTA